MEAATTSSLLLLVSVPTRSSFSSSSRSPLVLPRRLPFPCSSTFTAKKQQQSPISLTLDCKKKNSSFRSSSTRCSSSSADGPSTVGSSEAWVLDPAGDGDWRHIGYKVPRPGAFQIAAVDSVTVGRVADKADIVLPVATVSGTHARLEKKDDGSLVVTDLDSTNGTYINERRLVPGFPVPIQPGSLLIFGDTHLAMFRVSKQTVVVVETPPRELAGGADEQRNETDAAVSSAAATVGDTDTTTG